MKGEGRPPVRMGGGARSVTVVSFTDLARDARVNRQIRFLLPHYRVAAVGTADPGIPGVTFRRVTPVPRTPGRKVVDGLLLLTRRFERYYWRQPVIQDAAIAIRESDSDVVIANDIEALPVSRVAGSAARILFDAHEYAPLELADDWRFRTFFQRYRTYLCQRYIPGVDAMTTVGPVIAERYRRETGVDPRVVLNAPVYVPRPLPPPPPEGEPVRLVHHGGAIRGRRLESMIDMVKGLGDRYRLDMLLVASDRGYLGELAARAERVPGVRILPPVPPSELLDRLRGYDLGVYILQPSNYNNLNALPNKVFEFIHAGLGVAVSPNPEMARIVTDHRCGVVARDFSASAMADALRPLTRDRIRSLREAAAAAAPRLSGEQSEGTLLGLVEELLRADAAGSGRAGDAPESDAAARPARRER